MSRANLQTRFLLRVLLPPFIILVVISIAGYLLLSVSVRDRETAGLQRIASATAAKLDREFALRQVILRNTGAELFSIKSEQREGRTKLTADYEKCKQFIGSSNQFVSAPGNVCEPFFAQFAVALQSSTSLQSALNISYAKKTNELIESEQFSVNHRLKEFVKFFPETSQLLITDKKLGVISQAGSGQSTSDEYPKYLEGIAKKAVDKPVEALFAKNGDMRQVIFAYPIDQGSVLAAYNLDHAGFLYPSWKSAPVDSSKAFIVIADKDSKKSYPGIIESSLYQPVLNARQTETRVNFTDSNVDYLATSEPVGKTKWVVIVASPTAIALESLANTQILVVAIAGLLLLSFLWMGSLFVRRTVDSILSLVGGAVIFSGGQLSHRIDASRMSDKEFSQLADTMNNMAGKIQDAEAAIDQKNKEFISVATHEIKAPMTAVIGSLSMMLDDGMGVIDDTARKLADQAYRGTIRLRGLVNELLDIARLESGRAKFELVRLDLPSEIKEMIEVQKTPAAEKGITVRYKEPAESMAVTADKTKLEVILTNFISNGIKYNRPQGEVTISHQVTNGSIQITIKDTGLGIPKEQQAQMFQKFFRVEGSDRTNIPGTGLGMYITKQFIEGMGGKLWFESEQGKGTTFHFTLPLAAKVDEQPKQNGS